VEKVPAGQAIGSGTSAKQYMPAGQASQSPVAVPLGSARHLPAGQGESK
jgi:hypothetical protein